MKIMLAIPALGSGGPDRVIRELAKWFEKNGHDVVVIVTREEHVCRAQIQGVRIRNISRGTNRMSKNYPVVGAILAIREERPDVILTTLRMIMTVAIARLVSGRRTTVVARPANHHQSVAVEQRFRTWRHSVAFALEAWSIRAADGVVAQSADLEKSVIQLGFRGPIRVIGNPVSEVSPVEPLNLKGEPRMVVVGRLAHQKGVDLAIRALKLMLSSFPSAHLHVVGDGEERVELERLVEELALGQSVTFHGFKRDTIAYMSNSDFLVAPSRYEGFSNVIIEAQAAGVPVLATDCPGAATTVLIRTGGGLVATTNSIESLAENMVVLWKTISSYNKTLISEITLATWGIHKIGQDYVEFLSDCVMSRRGRP